MVIELQEEEARDFLQLVFLGEYVMNGDWLEDGKRKRIAAIVDKVMLAYLPKMEDQDEANGVLSDLHEELLEETEDYLRNYEQDNALETLAVMLAEKNYPYTEVNSPDYLKNLAAQTIYDMHLEDKGLDIVTLDIPDFEQEYQVLADLLITQNHN